MSEFLRHFKKKRHPVIPIPESEVEVSPVEKMAFNLSLLYQARETFLLIKAEHERKQRMDTPNIESPMELLWLRAAGLHDLSRYLVDAQISLDEDLPAIFASFTPEETAHIQRFALKSTIAFWDEKMANPNSSYDEQLLGRDRLESLRLQMDNMQDTILGPETDQR